MASSLQKFTLEKSLFKSEAARNTYLKTSNLLHRNEINIDLVEEADGVQDEEDYRDKSVIDFSHLKMESLAFLETKPPKKVREFYLDKNNLTDVQLLGKFETIQILHINDNQYLKDLELKFDRLKELELRGCAFQKIPNLKLFPVLESLDMSYNYIQDILDCVRHAPRLKSLNLRKNMIDYSSDQLQDVINEFTECPNLTELDISENPFGDRFPVIHKYIIKNCPQNLSAYGGKPIPQVDLETIKRTPLTPISELTDKQLKQEREKAFFVSTGSEMADLLGLVEAATYDPINCVRLVSEMAQKINEIINRGTQFWDEVFTARGNPTLNYKLITQMDVFLENCVILVENSSNIQNTVLTALANLVVIHANDFGKKALKLFNNFLADSSSRQVRVTAQDRIRNIVLEHIRFDDVMDVPLNVINYFLELITIENVANLFKSLEYTFVQWLSQIYYDMKSNNQTEIRILQRYANILELVQRVCSRQEFCTSMMEQTVVKKKGNDYSSKNTAQIIYEIFLYLNYQLKKENHQKDDDSHVSEHDNPYDLYHEMILCVIKLLQYSSKNHPDSAKYYAVGNMNRIVDVVSRLINQCYEDYKSHNYWSQGDEAYDQEEIAYKFRFFCYLIDLFGEFFEYMDEKQKTDIFRESSWLFKMLNSVSADKNAKIDPLLLCSICKITLNIFYSPFGLNKWIVSEILSSLGELVPIQRYLEGTVTGGAHIDIYGYICEEAEKYQRGALVNNDPVPFESLTNKIIIDLYVSIIDLLGFVCKYSSGQESKYSKIRDLCQKASNKLNLNSREAILFNCLKIPNDDVKLAVAQCLNYVPIDEIEADELTHFARLIADYKNLGAGRTEEVLSLIFMIMTKVLRSDGAASREFINKYAENALVDSLDILHRNMQRNLIHELSENEEKVSLSVAVIHFLKAASDNSVITTHMTGERIVYYFVSSLKYEEQYLPNYPIPISIEMTYIGKQVEYVFQVLDELQSLTHPCQNIFRIVARLADILMGIEYPFVDIEGEDLDERLRAHEIETYEKRIHRELQNWVETEELDKMEWEKQRKVEKTRFFLNAQHGLIASFEGLSRVVEFIKKPMDDISSKELLTVQQLNFKERVKLYTQSLHKKQIEAHKREVEEILNVKQKKPKVNVKKDFGPYLEKMLKKIDNSTEIDLENLDRIVLVPPPEDQNYSSTWNPLFRDSKKAQKNFQKMASLLEISQSLNPIDGFMPDLTYKQKIKVLIASSAMRVVNAAVVYCPDEMRVSNLKQILHLDTIRAIAQMCYDVGWEKYNIAAKFLRICIHVLEDFDTVEQSVFQDKKRRQNKIEDLPDVSDDEVLRAAREKRQQQELIDTELSKLSFFQVVSKAVSNILISIQTKIKNVDRKPLTTDDYTLIYNMAEACAYLCSHISSMNVQMVGVEEIQKDGEQKVHGGVFGKTLPEQVNEFTLSQLLPIHVVKTLLDIVIMNMDLYSDPTKIKNKTNFTLALQTSRAISTLLSEYIGTCSTFKYEVLKYINDVEIFGNKPIRQTFIQDLLDEAQRAKIKNRLHYYAMEKGFFGTIQKESFNIFQECDLIREGENTQRRRYLAIGGEAFFIFTPSTAAPCSICSPERFCPDGPGFEFAGKVSEIQAVYDFQELYIVGFLFSLTKRVNKNPKGMENEHRIIKFSFNFLKSRAKDEVIEYLKKKRKNIFEIRTPRLSVAKELKLTILSGIQLITTVHLFQNHHTVQKTDYKGHRNVLVLAERRIYIFELNPQFLCYDKNYEETLHDKFENKTPRLSPTLGKKKAIPNQKDPDELKLLQITKMQYRLDDLKEMYFNKSKVATVELKFSNGDLNILMSGDLSREKFKFQLFQALGDIDLEKDTQTVVKKQLY